MNEDLQSFAKEMINKWGKEAQLRQAQEEAAELIVAISHYLRTGAVENLYEEVADVYIMIAQLLYILEEDNVQYWIAKKMSRNRNVGGGANNGGVPCLC